MRNALLLSFLILLFIFLEGCGHRSGNTTGKPQKKDGPKVFKIHFDVQPVNPAVADTFQVWKQFFRYWELPSEISEDELRDRLELIQNALTRMRRSPLPPRLDTVDIQSRLALVENETRQLRWTLDNHWDRPRPDSILHRWLDSYENLVHQINFFATGSEDFEAVFRAKQKRDSLLLREFGDGLTPKK